MSCAGICAAEIMRQILSCAIRSTSMEIRMAKPKLASSLDVNKAVEVKKPGPIAEVAIKNAAPINTELRLERMI